LTTIRLAKTAGFCFGVNRAVKQLDRLLDENERVCTLGPIIHNPQVVERFAARGARIVSDPSEVNPDEIMVIRSHGVGREVYEAAEKLGIRICDMTCPFVSKIHRLVHEHTSAGAIALIAGDEHHPEVKGIRGHCAGESFVFSCEEELERLTKTEIIPKYSANFPIIMVAQTTFHMKTWENSVKYGK